MIKKIYERPQMKVVNVKPMSIICTSSLTSVNVSPDEEMGEYEEFE